MGAALEVGEADRRGGAASAAVTRESLLSLLAEAGVASEEQLRLAVAEGMGSGERLGEVALRRGWVDEVGLGRLLARQWGLRFVAGEELRFDRQAAALLSFESARRLGACMVADGSTAVAVADPGSDRLSEIGSLLDERVEFAVVTKSALDRLLDEMASTEVQAEAAEAAELAAASDAAETELTDTIVAEVAAATASLANLHGRMNELVRARQQAEEELAECQRRLSLLEGERSNERATIERLQVELAEQRQLVGAVKAKLTEATQLLDA